MTLPENFTVQQAAAEQITRVFNQFGGASNIVDVPITGITDQGGGNYTVSLGTPVNLLGTHASDWAVVSQGAGESDGLVSSNRFGGAWFCQFALQCGPEVANRRAFCSAFEDRAGVPTPVGITGAASGMRDNNDRANAIIFYGALQPGNALFFTISWNGAAPLTLNSGQVLLLSA